MYKRTKAETICLSKNTIPATAINKIDTEKLRKLDSQLTEPVDIDAWQNNVKNLD